MLKKILIICLAYLVIALAFSCHPCRCDNKDVIFKFIELNTFPSTYEFPNDSTYTINNTYRDSMQYGTYGIIFEMDKEEVVFQKNNHSCVSLFSSAYACSCIEPTFTTNDPIISVEIFTKNDFDSSHLSGSNITEYFTILEYSYIPLTITKKSISEIISHYYKNSDYRLLSALQIYLDKNPIINNTVAFEVKVMLESGKEFTSTTIPVTLL